MYLTYQDLAEFGSTDNVLNPCLACFPEDFETTAVMDEEFHVPLVN